MVFYEDRPVVTRTRYPICGEDDLNIQIRAEKEKKRRREKEIEEEKEKKEAEPPKKKARIEVRFDTNTEKLSNVGKKLKNIAHKEAIITIDGITNEESRWKVIGQGASQIVLTQMDDEDCEGMVIKLQRNGTGAWEKMIEHQKIIEEIPYRISPEIIMQAEIEESRWKTPMIIAAVEKMQPLSAGVLTIEKWISIAEAFTTLSCGLADLGKVLCDVQLANLAIDNGRLNIIDYECIAILPAHGRRREINNAVKSLCKNAIYPGQRCEIGCAPLVLRMRDWWINDLAGEQFCNANAANLAAACRRHLNFYE